MSFLFALQYHVYQPLFTLVGAGIKTVSQSERPMSKVLPSQCVHYPYKVTEFHPDNNLVILNNGEIVSLLFGLRRYRDKLEN